MLSLIRDITNQSIGFINWLRERTLRQEILKTRKIPRNELLEKERKHQEKN